MHTEVEFMLTKIKLSMVALSLLASTLFADELPKASVDITTGFVSNYVWRGADVFGPSLADQKGLYQDGKIQAWAFQPDITFATPVEGLSFGIWGSFATNYRNDADSDQRIQQGPGGNSIEFNTALDIVRAIDFTSMSQTTGAVSLHSPDCEATTNCLPGFYKEQNGLKRFDEIDFTLDYTRETNVGTMSFGIIYYSLPNITAKGDSVEEVYVGYSLPNLSELSLTAYTDVTSGSASNNYISLAYENSYKVAEDFEITYGASAGYGIKSNLQGVQDVNASVGIESKGFFATVNVTHRPDSRFFDEDQGVGGDSLPLYLAGQSTRSDGLITDKSKTVGTSNVLVNQQIQNAIDLGIGPGVYTYTPRQKIPSEIYWVSFGYTLSL